jgi:hypothetical protein
MTDTTNTQPAEPIESSRLGPRSSADYEPGIDLVEVHRDERLDAGRDRDRDLSVREAADLRLKNRKETQLGKDYADVQGYTENQRWGDGPDDPNASGTQSDLPRIASRLAEIRQEKKDLAAQYLEQQYGQEGEQGAAADPAYQQQQQAAEQEAINAQVRQQELATAQAQQQQAVSEIEQAKYLQAQYAQQLQEAKNALATAHNTEFPDVRTYEQLSELSRNDPQRFQRYLDLQQKYNQANEEHQRVAASQQQVAAIEQQQQQYRAAAWAHEQDAQFEQAHPHLRDPAAKQAATNQVLEYLTQVRGLTLPQIQHMWNNDATFRSASAQAMMFDAAQMHFARTRAREITAKKLPPVQKPGVARDKAWANHEQLSALGQKLGQTGSVRDAAALLRARRASR